MVAESPAVMVAGPLADSQGAWADMVEMVVVTREEPAAAVEEARVERAVETGVARSVDTKEAAGKEGMLAGRMAAAVRVEVVKGEGVEMAAKAGVAIMVEVKVGGWMVEVEKVAVGRVGALLAVVTWAVVARVAGNDD